MSVLNNPAKVPACGPYGKAVWSADTGRWVRRLTDEGKKIATEYLDRWPNPVAMLFDVFPRVTAAARASGIEEDDLAQLARVGVVAAVAVYDPARGSLSTVVAWHIRSKVQDFIGRSDQTRRLTTGPTFVRFGADQEYDVPDHRDKAGADVERRDDLRHLRAAICTLPPRHRKVLGLRMAGHKLESCAERMGVSKERCRQIEVAAREKLKEMMTGGGA